MLEYYESVSELTISQDFNDVEVWKALCLIIGKSNQLESITFKEMNIDEMYMRIFLNAVRSNTNITILKFDSCALVKLPTFYLGTFINFQTVSIFIDYIIILVDNLKLNTSLRELYLPQTGLYTKEADCLSKFLSKNVTLQVLDISNNPIGDRGLDALAHGLTNPDNIGPGLSVLIIFNNQLTEKSGPTICNIIVSFNFIIASKQINMKKQQSFFHV